MIQRISLQPDNVNLGTVRVVATQATEIIQCENYR